ncbi:EamA family transporter [Kitasatospora sp. NPDC004240]
MTAPASSRPAVAAGKPADRPARLGGAVWAALLVVYVVWGSTYLGIRVVVETVPAFLSSGARFVAAGLLLAALVAWRSGPDALRVDRRQLLSSALVGLLLVTGGNGLVVLGEESIPSGLAALLVAAVPLWMVVLSAVGGERPRPVALAGVLLGLAGLAVLSAPALGGAVAPVGVIAVLAATMTWAAGSFAAKRIPMPGDVFAGSAYQMVAGGIGSALVGLARGEQHVLDVGAISGRSWLALAYLVLVGSLVGFTAYAWLLRSAPLTLVGTYAYVNPVVAVLLGRLVLAEPLTRPTLVGGAIVVVGVCLVISSSSRAASRPGPAPRPSPGSTART